MKRWLLLWLGLILAVAPSAQGQSQYPSRRDPFINDYANLLTTADAAAVRALLSDLKSAHGIEAVVVTIDSINDYQTYNTTFESFATGLFNAWGLGDATKNDGVLLLVAVNDRKVRVELGAGYGSGPSSEMQAVIDRYLVPKFRAAEYSSGILLGTRAMIAKLTDQPMPETDDIPPTSVPFASTSYDSPTTQTTDSSGVMALLLVVGVGAGVYVVAKALNGEGSSTYADDDDDDNRRSWSDDRPRSSWWGSSSRRSSSSSRSGRSSSSSSRGGGGRSSGGGASGSW